MNALDALELAADTKLRNEEELPIANNYLPDKPTVPKAKDGV